MKEYNLTLVVVQPNTKEFTRLSYTEFRQLVSCTKPR